MKALILFSLLFTTFTFSQQKWVSDNAKWTYKYYTVAEHGYLTVEEVDEQTIQGELCKSYETTKHTYVMNQFGDSALFYLLALIQCLLACFVIFRMMVRSALPVKEQESFVMQGSVIVSAVELDPRTACSVIHSPTSADDENSPKR